MEQKKFDLKTISGFSSTIVNYKNSISKFLNPRYGITAEDFIETCIRAVKENPKLLQCDPKSLFGAVLLSAEIGLKPNTSQQHSFIIPYKGQAKFQIGYKGLIEIMYRNPRVKKIEARAVYENDEFDYGYGLKPFLNHKPARKERGKLDCVYATCLVDEEPIFVVVEKAELDAIRKFSQTIDTAYSPYNNGTDIHNWMEIKAGVKALSKLIPTSNNIDMAKAVEYDSRFEGGARVMVELPNNPNEVVEPKLVDTNFISNTFDTAFDIIEEEEKKLVINQIKETNKTKEFIKPDSQPIQFEKQSKENYKSDFEWEIPIGDFDDNLEKKSLLTTESILVNEENEEDDISFDFPDGEDDEDEIQSNIF